MPSNLLHDDYIDKEFQAPPATDSMRRAQEIREATAKAWMSLQDFETLSRAVRSNTRTADAELEGLESGRLRNFRHIKEKAHLFWELRTRMNKPH